MAKSHLTSQQQREIKKLARKDKTIAELSKEVSADYKHVRYLLKTNRLPYKTRYHRTRSDKGRPAELHKPVVFEGKYFNVNAVTRDATWIV
jgi:hypothetical protein